MTDGPTLAPGRLSIKLFRGAQSRQGPATSQTGPGSIKVLVA